MNPADGNSPLKVFGHMFGFYRDRAGLTYEDLAALVYLSASQVYKVERGLRAPSADLVTRCEAIPAMQCDGALRALYNSMIEYLKVGVFPGWFQGWPEKEAAAARLRNFELVVLPGLGQTEAYARALISARFGISPDEVDDEVAARLARRPSWTGRSHRCCGSSSTRPPSGGRSDRVRSCVSSWRISPRWPANRISWCR